MDSPPNTRLPPSETNSINLYEFVQRFGFLYVYIFFYLNTNRKITIIERERGYKILTFFSSDKEKMEENNHIGIGKHCGNTLSVKRRLFWNLRNVTTCLFRVPGRRSNNKMRRKAQIFSQTK